jgi:hypothetical protein
MRIDPKGAIRGHPALLVRACLKKLRARPSWNLAALEEAASLEAGTGKSLLRALSAAGLVKSLGRLGNHPGKTNLVLSHSSETAYTGDGGEGPS